MSRPKGKSSSKTVFQVQLKHSKCHLKIQKYNQQNVLRVSKVHTQGQSSTFRSDILSNAAYYWNIISDVFTYNQHFNITAG